MSLDHRAGHCEQNLDIVSSRAGWTWPRLTPDQYELWQERACIMHFDGKLSWQKAQALALADVLRIVAIGEDTAMQLGDGVWLSDPVYRDMLDIFGSAGEGNVITVGRRREAGLMNINGLRWLQNRSRSHDLVKPTPETHFHEFRDVT
jgi:hypothetical protein